MKTYRELHYSMSNDKKNRRIWANPIETRQVTVDENHAQELNAQFENTGIWLKEAPDESGKDTGVDPAENLTSI
jgi:hypothetical protein